MEWKTNPVTVELFDFFSRSREVIKDQWLQGAFTAEEGSGTIQLNSEAIGKAKLLDELCDFQLEWLGDFK